MSSVPIMPFSAFSIMTAVSATRKALITSPIKSSESRSINDIDSIFHSVCNVKLHTPNRCVPCSISWVIWDRIFLRQYHVDWLNRLRRAWLPPKWSYRISEARPGTTFFMCFYHHRLHTIGFRLEMICKMDSSRRVVSNYALRKSRRKICWQTFAV